MSLKQQKNCGVKKGIWKALSSLKKPSDCLSLSSTMNPFRPLRPPTKINWKNWSKGWSKEKKRKEKEGMWCQLREANPMEKKRLISRDRWTKSLWTSPMSNGMTFLDWPEPKLLSKKLYWCPSDLKKCLLVQLSLGKEFFSMDLLELEKPS